MKAIALVCFLLPCLVLAQSRAIPSDGGLLNLRRSALLRTIAKLDLPIKTEVVKDHEANLVFAVGAAYTDILAVAKPGDAAPQLGRDLLNSLRKAGYRSNDVEYSSEDGDLAVAVESTSSGRFGADSSTNIVPVGKIAQEMRSRGWNVGLVVRTPKYVSRNDNGLSYFEGGNYNWYGSTSPPSNALIDASCTLPRWGIFAFYALLAMPPFVTFLSVLIAFIYGSIKTIPIKVRRRNYLKLAIWPTFGAIACHMPLAMFFLVGRAYRPYADVWFGTSLAMSMSPFIMLPLPFIMALIPVSKVVEKKLFGPDAGAPPVHKPDLSVDERTLRKQMGRVDSILTIGVIAGLFGLGALPHASAFVTFAACLLVILALFGRVYAGRRYKRALRPFEGSGSYPVLESRASTLAEKMGVKFRRIRVDGSLQGRTAPAGNVSMAGDITLSKRAVEVLSPEELDGLIAHELAHLRLGHLKSRKFFFSACCILISLQFVAMTALLVAHVRLVSPTILMAPLLVLFPASFIFLGSSRGREREFASDRLAVETTGDPASYVSMLEKLVLNSPLPGLHEVDVASTHPAMVRRIEAVRRWGDENGFQLSRSESPEPDLAGL